MALTKSNFPSSALWSHRLVPIRHCAGDKDQFANAFFARMEEVSTIVPPPTEQKSSRDVYCLRTAKNDCIAVAQIQQIFRKQTCGVSDYTHRHDNAPTLWGVKRYQLPWLQVLRMRKAVMEQGELGSQECCVAKDGLTSAFDAAESQKDQVVNKTRTMHARRHREKLQAADFLDCLGPLH